MSSDKGHRYRFGPYELDVAERVLKRNGEIVSLPLKPFEVLLTLVEQHGNVVSKEDLLRQVWPDSIVEEANLARHIYTLRQTLGENAKDVMDKHRYIQTIPGRGYRFACELEVVHLVTGIENHGAFKSDVVAETDDPLPATQQIEDIEVVCERGVLAPSRKQFFRPWRLSVNQTLAVTLALTLLVSLTVFLITLRSRVAELQPEPTIIRLTSDTNMLNGSTSPDGKYVVSFVDENGQHSVWVKLSSNGSEKQIVPPGSFDLWGLAFSTDSNFVYYNATIKQNRISTLCQVPIMGGTVHKIREGLNSHVSFAPDGIHFAFVREDIARGRSSLLIGSLNDESEREIIARETPEFLDYPAWSPDGDRIALTFNTPVGGFQSRLLEVNLDNGEERLLPTPSWRYIRKPIWLKDGSGLIVTATERFHFINAWFLPYPPNDNNAPRRLTNGMRVSSGVSITNNTRELVFTEMNRYANVWVTESSETSAAMKITSGAAHYEDLTWTPDGRLLYVSDANGYWNIWVMNADGRDKRQLTYDTHDNSWPSMSPDGRYIFYTSYRNGTSTIWRMDANGSNPKQLTFGGDEFEQHCMPDGKWLIFNSYNNDSAFTLRKVSVEGGEPTPLSRTDMRDGVVSPDGRYVACLLSEGRSSASVKPTNLAIMSLADGVIRKLGFINPQRGNSGNTRLRWMPNSSGIVYTDSSDGDRNLWVQPLTGSPPRRLTDFKGDQIFGFDFSRDGRLAVLRGAVKREIVKIINPTLK